MDFGKICLYGMLFGIIIIIFGGLFPADTMFHFIKIGLTVGVLSFVALLGWIIKDK